MLRSGGWGCTNGDVGRDEWLTADQLLVEARYLLRSALTSCKTCQVASTFKAIAAFEAAVQAAFLFGLLAIVATRELKLMALDMMGRGGLRSCRLVTPALPRAERWVNLIRKS